MTQSNENINRTISLSIEKLSVHSSKKCILNDVSFACESNEVVAIIGPNGAGKSTLLHALAGGNHSQNTRLNNQLLAMYSETDIAQIIAVHMQHNSVPFNFTVREIVAMGRYPFSTGDNYDASVIDQVLQIADMEPLQYEVYAQLSGGEQQRTHIARALAQAWPSSFGHFLLLDEPTSALDFYHQVAILDAIKNTSQQGVGVVFVTHDINLAAQYADRVIVLHQGEIHTEGQAKDIMQVDVLAPVFGSRLTQVYDESSGHHFLFSKR